MNINNILEKHNNNLTFIRIFLAYLVIISHAYPLTGSNDAEFFVKYLGVSGGGIAVYGFFFISGMLVLKSLMYRKNAGVYLIARVFRIFPALIFATLFLSLIIGPIFTKLTFTEYLTHPELLSFIKNNIILKTQFSLPEVFNDLPYKSAINGSWWTIAWEFKFYIILMFLWMIGLFKNRYIASLFFIIVLISIFFKFPPVISFFNNIPSNYNLAILFSYGCLFWIWNEYIKINLVSVIGIIGLTFIFRHTEMYYWLFFISIGMICLYISIQKVIVKYNNIPDISYGVYIYGFFSQQLIIYFYPEQSVFINSLFSIIISSIFGYLSFRFLENPAIKLGSKISKKISN